jgi:thioredoxin-dependent peroxiredoxin
VKNSVILVLAIAAVLFLLPSAGHAASVPQPGASAPNFTLPSHDASKISLDQFRGKWVVLYFYPKDMTSGCTIEAHNFQRDQQKYIDRNAVVLGVSVDGVDSHQKFCTKEGLNFKLLSDSDHTVTEEYGSLTNLGLVKFASRHTFIIDPKGKIAKVYTDVDPNEHSAEVLAALAELQK